MTDDRPDEDAASPADHLQRLLDKDIRPRQLLYAATAIGIFDALRAGAKTAADLAREVRADQDSLYRVLRGLVALDVLREVDDGRFALAPAGHLLCRGEPDSLRVEVLLRGEQDRTWATLLDGVRTGRTPFVSVFGEGVFDHVARDPDLSAALHDGMADWADEFEKVAAACPLPEAGLVVDVGGGRGDLLAALLRRARGLRGVLFDAAAEAAGATAFLAKAGMADRCRVEAGDFFAAVPGGGDVYVLCRILHDWNDAAAGRLLDRCRAAMPESARLLVVDKLLPECVADNPSAIFLDLDMMVGLGGRQRSVPEHRTLLARHGFRLDEVVDRAPASSVLMARPVA